MHKFRIAWLLLIGSVLYLPTLQAQPLDVTWGETVKESRRSEILNFIGQNEDGYFVLKGAKTTRAWTIFGTTPGWTNLRMAENVSMVRLDDGMNPAQENPVDLEEEGKSLNVEAAFQVKDKFYIFSSFLNQRTKMKHIFVQGFDPNTLTPQGNISKVTSIPYQSRYLSGRVDFTFSRDSSYLMVYTNVRSKRKDPDKFGFKVYDRDMNPVWNREIVLPYQERKFLAADYIVDNEGNAYLVGKRYFERNRESIRGRPNFEYVVYAYRNDGQDEAEYVINLRENFLSELHLEIAPSGDLICAGFYSERTGTSAKGTFYFTVDAQTKEIKRKSLYEFELEFLTQGLTQRQGNKVERQMARGRDPVINQYDIRDLIPRGDGGTVLVAEQYYVRVVTTNDRASGVNTTKYYYHYNTIVVISIDPNGQIEWATKVPKRQVSVNDNGFYSSFATMITNGKLYFIYNDHRDNIVENRTSRLKNFRLNEGKGIIALASVDSEGNVSRKPLLSNRDVTTICRPKMCSQISPYEMLIFGKRGRKTQFGKVNFD